MTRPRADEKEKGLTSGQAAKQLKCCRSNVDRLRKCGLLPGRQDRAGNWRYQPRAVAEAARKLGRNVRTDDETAARIYGYFLAPGFRGTPKELARIVHETTTHPDVVLDLWQKYRLGANVPTANDQVQEIDRLAREYDEQIAIMDQELARKRRAAFIPGEWDDEGPPSSKRTGT
jgi:hypothetical protein